MRFLRYAIKASISAQDHYYNLPRVKGFMGEKIVRKQLTDYEYVIYDYRIYLSGETQIDHILINQSGIIVIETKNYSGVITGAEDKKIWIQHIGKTSRTFLSPIKQNDYHILQLKKLLSAYDVPYYSIIVFSSQSIFNLNVKSSVIQIDQLKDTISQLPQGILNKDIQKKLYDELLDYQKNMIKKDSNLIL